MRFGKFNRNEAQKIFDGNNDEGVVHKYDLKKEDSASSLSELTPRHRPNFLRACQLSGGNRFVKRKR
ncbi:hypothetical protein P4C99_19680, partial [Pontiellaceae bacterium B1224]|nr:hypothetical protein [Pontiellaceae bacterium B1224]